MIASNNSPTEKRTRLQCGFVINIMGLLFCDRKYFLLVTQKMKIKSSKVSTLKIAENTDHLRSFIYRPIYAFCYFG
jgi:hypothetical protein